MPAAQAPRQFGKGRWQQENAQRFGQAATHLGVALYVYVEDDIFPTFQNMV